ncbi:hypothetical protein [Actinokineospora pegani]|uniref:hypothetical protein n=1 Tax=Actinokineospora pegani TaxID=2654637 RepID=UPI0012E9BAC2|nr:hypothetical protein [Actinokineospora pegani]
MAEQRQRTRPDWLLLVLGLLTMWAAASVLTDGGFWIPGLDGRWLLAALSVVVGLGLLANSRQKRS